MKKTPAKKIVKGSDTYKLDRVKSFVEIEQKGTITAKEAIENIADILEVTPIIKVSAKQQELINRIEEVNVLKKTSWKVTCDLVDKWIDEKITQDELVEKLMTLVGKPIIIVSEVEFIVSEWEGQLYLESRQELSDGNKSNWVQVDDLCDLTVCEYNDLVTQLHEVYPDYPIEHLEGRFV